MTPAAVRPGNTRGVGAAAVDSVTGLYVARTPVGKSPDSGVVPSHGSTSMLMSSHPAS